MRSGDFAALERRRAAKPDHFVKGEGLDPLTIKVKSHAYPHYRGTEAKADQVNYALSQFLLRCV